MNPSNCKPDINQLVCAHSTALSKFPHHADSLFNPSETECFHWCSVFLMGMPGSLKPLYASQRWIVHLVFCFLWVNSVTSEVIYSLFTHFYNKIKCYLHLNRQKMVIMVFWPGRPAPKLREYHTKSSALLFVWYCTNSEWGKPELDQNDYVHNDQVNVLFSRCNIYC